MTIAAYSLYSFEPSVLATDIWMEDFDELVFYPAQL